MTDQMIGVSNFSTPKRKRLLKTAKIHPVAYQVELHPYFPQKGLIEFCQANDIHVIAHSPLGGIPIPVLVGRRGPGPLEDSTVLHYFPISNYKRIAENFDVLFDFEHQDLQKMTDLVGVRGENGVRNLEMTAYLGSTDTDADDEASLRPMKSETRIDVVSSNARPAAVQKRASEPSISTIASQVTGSEGHNFQRNTSLSGSEYPTSTSQIRRPSNDALANTASTVNPLGLTLIHSARGPLVGMVFIHGFGGTSRGTWSWERDTRNFWPGWLVDDAELSRSRIFTFGYFATSLVSRARSAY
ncbi:hypothetical protein EAF04_004140 [Stromatinia cepivora]|nr:hypothetical protein EAF04_004140 [Stromatinia cepivora]